MVKHGRGRRKGGRIVTLTIQRGQSLGTLADNTVLKTEIFSNGLFTKDHYLISGDLNFTARD